MKWRILIIFLFLIPCIHAKAGGVPQGNYTNLTLSASQALPNCGQNAPCHLNYIDGTNILVSITEEHESTICVGKPTNITITLTTNESIDEVGCLLMNRTQPDNTGYWAEGVGVIILSNNASGHNDNYQENLSELHYILTVILNSSGKKDLTLHCKGGTDTVGNQDWRTEYNLTFNAVAKELITLTMTDLNVYSFDIPIINKFYTSNNELVLYKNGDYNKTVTTNGVITICSYSNYTIAFKPSKKGSLSSVPIFIEFLSYYYKVIFCILILSIVVVKIIRSR